MYFDVRYFRSLCVDVRSPFNSLEPSYRYPDTGYQDICTYFCRAFFVKMTSFLDVLDPANRLLGWFYADPGGTLFSQSFFHVKVTLLWSRQGRKMPLFIKSRTRPESVPKWTTFLHVFRSSTWLLRSAYKFQLNWPCTKIKISRKVFRVIQIPWNLDKYQTETVRGLDGSF